jgi:hypothetical protein
VCVRVCKCVCVCVCVCVHVKLAVGRRRKQCRGCCHARELRVHQGKVSGKAGSGKRDREVGVEAHIRGLTHHRQANAFACQWCLLANGVCLSMVKKKPTRLLANGVQVLRYVPQLVLALATPVITPALCYMAFSLKCMQADIFFLPPAGRKLLQPSGVIAYSTVS